MNLVQQIYFHNLKQVNYIPITLFRYKLIIIENKKLLRIGVEIAGKRSRRMTTVTSLLILFSVAVLLIQSWAIKASSNINGMDFLVMGDDQFEDGNYESAGEFYMKALSTGVPNIPVYDYHFLNIR